MVNKDDFNLICGDNLEVLKTLPDCSVDCCVTSPPYYGLRDYGTAHWEGGDPNCNHYRDTKVSANDITGHKQMGDCGQQVGDAIYKCVCPKCGAVRVDKQVGLEESPKIYIDRLVSIFREVKRVLKDDGTLWVNIGDSYNTSKTASIKSDKQKTNVDSYAIMSSKHIVDECKPKDLIGIPWMLAFALREDGWYLRQDIIWCLSGGAWIYVKSQHGIMPIMVRELSRLDISKVQLWDGNNWVNINGFEENTFYEDKLEFTLRSGERISCTDGHRWILNDGSEVIAKDLKVGDILKTVSLPNCENHKPNSLTKDALWLIGLYLAEGSHCKDGNVIQLSLNADELKWFERIKSVAEYYGGTASYTIDGNKLAVRIWSRVFNAVLSKYIGGKTAKDKHLNNICWEMPNEWLKELITGYFDGDGHYDGDNNRIRLGFTRNYYLERDLRILAARLGAKLHLSLSTSKIGDIVYKTFKGEWRWEISNHFNNKNGGEIVKIQKSKARHFYDISVDSDSHTFALASGVLTHNCKPNPMPESVTDRCTKSHEYIFLLSKSPRYYFDYEQIQEIATGFDGRNDILHKGSPKYSQAKIMPGSSIQSLASGSHNRWKFANIDTRIKFGGNKYGDSNDTHYQTYSGDTYKCKMMVDGNVSVPIRNKRDVWNVSVSGYKDAHFATYPMELIEPCILSGSKIGGTVLDPFNGSGTTGIVQVKNGRKYIGIDLNKDYVDLSYNRFDETFFGIQKQRNDIANSDGMKRAVLIDE